MNSTINFTKMVTTVAATAIIAAEPAFAGACVPAGVPAPLLGAGIPALMVFAGGYWAMRKRRKD